MARQYFTRKFKPSIPANLQVAAFAVGDVVFDWQSFTLPNGVNKLTGATVIAPPNASAASQDFPLDLLFATKTRGNGGVAAGAAPQGVGTVNSAGLPTASPYYNDLIGAIKIDATDFTDIEPRSIGVTGVAQGGMNPVIFDNYDDSADSYGDNTFYMAAFSAGTPTIGGGINIAGGGSPVAAGSSATVTVEAQDARAFFAPGDVIHGAGNEILGTVSTVTNGTTIVLTTTTVAELADDLDLYNFNPIQIILSFERP
tara:strand:+ start:1038 stop:1805 length:768 start_codon:yes stop_codon:yes gene_type:complete